MFFSFCFYGNNHEWNFRIRTMMHEKAPYLKMCGCVDGHRRFPVPSLEAVVCVTVVIDNPFTSTWRLMWRDNSHGTVSLPFKIETRSSAEFTDFSFSSGDWKKKYLKCNPSSQISLFWWRYGANQQEFISQGRAEKRWLTSCPFLPAGTNVILTELLFLLCYVGQH